MTVLYFIKTFYKKQSLNMFFLFDFTSLQPKNVNLMIIQAQFFFGTQNTEFQNKKSI